MAVGHSNNADSRMWKTQVPTHSNASLVYSVHVDSCKIIHPFHMSTFISLNLFVWLYVA